MDRIIGLDVHPSSCTLGVMTPKGKREGQEFQTPSRAESQGSKGLPGGREGNGVA